MMGQEEEQDRVAASLAAARRTLRAGVEKSRALGHALARAGPRLEEIQVALPALEAAVRWRRRCARSARRGTREIRSAAALDRRSADL